MVPACHERVGERGFHLPKETREIGIVFAGVLRACPGAGERTREAVANLITFCSLSARLFASNIFLIRRHYQTQVKLPSLKVVNRFGGLPHRSYTPFRSSASNRRRSIFGPLRRAAGRTAAGMRDTSRDAWIGIGFRRPSGVCRRSRRTARPSPGRAARPVRRRRAAATPRFPVRRSRTRCPWLRPASGLRFPPVPGSMTPNGFVSSPPGPPLRQAVGRTVAGDKGHEQGRLDWERPGRHQRQVKLDAAGLPGGLGEVG